MKKFTVLLSVLLCLAMLVIPFAGVAETTKADLIAEFEKAIPAEYHSLYMPQVKNLLAQVDVSADQADELIDMLHEMETVYVDKGQSLDTYSGKEQTYFVEKFNEGMSVLNLTYSMEDKEGTSDGENLLCHIYNVSGEELIALDGDVGADKTDVAENNALYLVLAGAFLVLAGVAFVVTRKKASAN